VIELTTLFSVGAVGMLVGTLLFAWAGVNASRAEGRYYLTLVGIGGIAAVAYGLMALGIGWYTVGERTVFIPRYVDWILTTPLIVLFLGLLAGIDRRTFAAAIGLNTLVMVAGFVAATLPGIERFALFGVGSVAFVGLVYYLFGPMTRRAGTKSEGIEKLYLRLRNLTAVLWSIYPLIWVLGPPGLNLLTTTIDIALITYLDLVTKVGFGLIALDASATLRSEFGVSLADADAGEDATPDDRTPTAGD
jgi:sensory rhodopsin